MGDEPGGDAVEICASNNSSAKHGTAVALGEDHPSLLRQLPRGVHVDPSRANLVCWPFGAGGGEDLAGGAGQRVGGDVGVTGDDDGDLLQRA